MRYYLDTEFIEDGSTIDLISIGIVCEDGREFYAINNDCNWARANDWVLENVLLPIGIDRQGWMERDPNMMSPRVREGYLAAVSHPSIGPLVHHFVGGQVEMRTMGTVDGVAMFQPKLFSPESKSKPEFWAYYADYDWVAFCQLFGTMMDLPKGFPMYCRDIKQWCDMLGNPKLPEQGKGEHNALEDARWNREAWEFLDKLQHGGHQIK